MTAIVHQHLIPTPEELSGNIPITENLSNFIGNSRNIVNNIIHGRDKRLLMIVGPCSIHNPEAALMYAKKLKQLSHQYSEELYIIMRVYFEKPRTSMGWKGLIYDPLLNNTFDINTGLQNARKLLFDINNLNLPVATEFVDTLIPQYIKDLVTWGAIGARTSESQIHRQLASSLDLPMGFKNSMSGDIHVAVNAVRMAEQPHHFLNINQQGMISTLKSSGNQNCHIILRGGRTHTNYDDKSIAEAIQLLNTYDLNPYVMVDCSHGNSQKDASKQADVVDSLCELIKKPNAPRIGVMLESHLKAGRQDFNPEKEPEFGLSITDACLSWEQTVVLIEKIAKEVSTHVSV